MADRPAMTYGKFTAYCFVVVGAIGLVGSIVFIGGACLLGFPEPSLCTTYDLEAPLNGLWLSSLLLVVGLLQARPINRRSRR